MDLIETIEKTPIKKTIEVFTVSHQNEKGESVPFNVKVQNRLPAVGLALKEAAAKAKQ